MPVHIYACMTSVQECLEYFEGDLNDGDVILISDPYHGGTHICDYTMMKPVFYDGKPIFFPSVRGHFLDVGAPYPGSANPMATEAIKKDFVSRRSSSTKKGSFAAMCGACSSPTPDCRKSTRAI